MGSNGEGYHRHGLQARKVYEPGCESIYRNIYNILCNCVLYWEYGWSLTQFYVQYSISSNRYYSFVYLTWVSLVARRTHAQLHVVGVTSGKQMLSTLQCGSTQRDRLSRLGVESSDLQRLQSHQHHHQLLPGHRVPRLYMTETSLQTE